MSSATTVPTLKNELELFERMLGDAFNFDNADVALQETLSALQDAPRPEDRPDLCEKLTQLAVDFHDYVFDME